MAFYNKDSYSLDDIEYLINNEVEENIHLDDYPITFGKDSIISIVSYPGRKPRL